MMTVDQDTICQYLDGRELLHTTLMEREQLLQELEKLVKASQEMRCAEKVARFPLMRAQTLLFELSVISEYIDSVIFEINCYAERCGKPRVQVIEMQLQ